MDSWPYAATATVQLATATAFVFVARAVWVRRSAGVAGAVHALSLWWISIAVYLATNAAVQYTASLEGPSLEVFLASRFVAVPVLALGGGCLTYYTLYLVSGRRRTALAAVPLFAVTLVVFAIVAFDRPTRLKDDAWQLVPVLDHPLQGVVYVLVGFPPVLAALSLLIVGRHGSLETRYRGRRVAVGILVYFASGLLAYAALDGFAHFLMLLVASGLGGWLVVRAYYPPRLPAIQGGGGTRNLPGSTASAADAQRQDAWKMRMRELL